MANTKISALTDGSPAQAGDQIPINRGGTNYRINAGTIGAPGPGFFNALNYGAVADNNTDNATAFAALATAVNAYSETAVNTQLVGAAVVYFPPGTYLYTSGLAFTQPVTLLGQRCGSLLNYTGSAHAVDMGPTGLTSSNYQSGEYTVKDLGFIGGTSMTYGLYFNTYLVRIRILGCAFRNFGNATSTVWAVYTAGNGTNWDVTVTDNTITNDDAVARNFLKVGSTSNENSQLHFRNNFMTNLASHNAVVGVNASGAGTAVWSNGTGSSITGNNFNFWNPVMHLGNTSNSTMILNNYSESPNDGLGKPIVEFETVSGILVDGLYTNLHSGGYVVGPNAGGTAKISNSLVQNIYAANNVNGAALIQENNLTGQTGNVYFNLQAQSSFIPNTTGGNIDAWKAVQTA